MEEKRKFARFDVNFPLKLDLDYTYRQEGTVKDISMKGLRVAVHSSLNILYNNPIDFHLLFPDNILEVCGETVWHKDYEDRKEVGFRFVRILDSQKEEIYNYVSKYHKDNLVLRWWQM